MSESSTVFITGSSRGIGKAIALRLAREGFDIVVHCRSNRAEAEQVQQQILTIGRQARILQFDIADRSRCRDILLADIEAHGTYYGIVCNAGLTRDNAFPACCSASSVARVAITDIRPMLRTALRV